MKCDKCGYNGLALAKVLRALLDCHDGVVVKDDKLTDAVNRADARVRARAVLEAADKNRP